MSVISAAPLFTARNSRSGYQIDQSLRFNSADSPYISRTPSSAGNRRTWTLSMWIKRATITPGNYVTQIFSAGASASVARMNIAFAGSGATGDNISFGYNDSGSLWKYVVTNAVYRDPSAWYHIVFSVDTTDATADDRIKIYVNGERQSIGSQTQPSQDAQLEWNNNVYQVLGAYNLSGASATYTNQYLAEVYNIDGTAHDASAFGKTNNQGVWVPKAFGGSYGTNGFYLDFSNSSSLGEDQAGSNDWTASGFTTSGTGTDVMSDTPTTNYATLNSLDSLGGNFFEGNLKFAGTYSSGGSQNGHGCRSTIRVPSGKWYVEASSTTYSGSGNSCMLGFTSSTQAISTQAFTANLTPWIGVDASVYNNNVKFYWNGVSGGTTSGTTLYTSYASGDIINFAIDFDAGKFWVGKNGSYAGDPGAGTNPTSTFTAGDGSWAFWGEYIASSNDVNRSQVNVNFGQRAFEYTQPSGFKAMNTANLPAPTIKDGSDYFNTVLWTGTSAEHAITGVGFQPDWSWIKGRTNTTNHVLSDVLRGSTGVIESDSDAQEYTDAQSVKSFDADGVTLGTSNDVNNSTAGYNSYVGWFWKAGGSGSTNTDGNLSNTVTVSANPSAGFSIVKYTGDGVSNATVGHGLNAVPSLVMSKVLSGTTGPWYVKHKDLSSGYNIYLNWTNAQTALTGGGGIGDLNSSTTFTCANGATNNGNVNASGYNYITYCFAEVEGFSKFGKYTGNGSTDGPFVHCGFRPAWVMWKQIDTDTDRHWVIRDSVRDVDNPTQQTLYPSLVTAEQTLTSQDVDFLSNGFKIRSAWDYQNASSRNYIYAAFAENPFGGDGVSPATAR